MQMRSEHRLWQHVLLAILTDLQSRSEHKRQDREFARRWVGHYPSRDFQLVFDLASLDTECVHRYFKQMAWCARPHRNPVTHEQTFDCTDHSLDKCKTATFGLPKVASAR